jgi:superfamily II DNA or RNA helicase
VESALRIASPAAVRAVIANVMLGSEQSEPPLGSIELKQHQTVAVERLISALHEFGGALLCDEVGMGKTFVALAVARRFSRVLVVAPAALERMWRDALSRTGMKAGFVSYERLSRTALDAQADLLILDEAHHARNQATHRYGRIAQLARHGAVLMLTATPVHNRRVDLVALLSLFLGSRASGLTAAESGRCVVRRDSRTNVNGIPTVLPVVRCEIPDDPGLVELLLDVPPPLPARDAGEAGSLINRGLVHQWASSEAALVDALHRRTAKARALASSLEAGRYPSARELEAWTCGDDALQLGFPELLAPSTPNAGSLLQSVTAHAQALGKILDRQRRDSPIDDARAETLRRIRSDWPHAKVVAFAQYSATVAALYRRLKRSGRVAMLTAKGAQVAGGRLSRNEAIARFAPNANRSRQPARAETIDLLVTTDLLSEGVNLQDAQVVVHFDVPWTAARLEQRVGRVARMGSHHTHVMVYQLQPPASAEAVLGGESLVARKRELARTLAGDASIQSRVECLRDILRRWTSAPVGSARTDRVLAAAVTAGQTGFIGVGDLRNTPMLLIGRANFVTTDLDAQIAACRLAEGPAAHADGTEYDEARRVIDQWADCNAASDSAGALTCPPAHRKRLLNRIDAMLQNAPPHLRASRARIVARARFVASAAHGAAVEHELQHFAHASMPDDDWLEALASLPVRDVVPHADTPFRLRAVLLLKP